jgi:hypothetical protein
MRAVVRARSCARARRALSLVLDDEARDEECQELARHLGYCAVCTEFATALFYVTRELRTWPRTGAQVNHNEPEGSTR